MKQQILSVEDLTVYQRLFDLALDVYHLSLTFPRYELYELGSQARRSSNSAPANLAEGWGNRHLRIYLEGVTRAMGEVRETRHHLRMAHSKGYLTKERLDPLLQRYDECKLMLAGLERSLLRRIESPQSRGKGSSHSPFEADVR